MKKDESGTPPEEARHATAAEGGAEPEAGAEPKAGAEITPASPYKNMWVPLVVVPALLVMVLALVGLLFGAIGGEPRSAEDYVKTLVAGGGRNERQQALFGLSQLVAESARARLEGDEARWEADRRTLEPLLELAWERAREDEHQVRFVIAALSAQLGGPEGVPRLVALLALDEAQDPGAALRFEILANLGAIGDERAFAALDAHSRHDDKGLRSMAVIGLQKLPLELVRGTLLEALRDEELEVRGNSATVLSRLGDPAGAAVLRDLIDPALYAAERERDPRRFAGSAQVSRSRIVALEALARLRRPEDRELVARLADEDADVNLRGVAKRIQRDW